MFKTTEYSGAFFDSNKSDAVLIQEYNQKLAAFQNLVATVAPEDKTTLSTTLPTSTACRVNPITNQWESVEERKKREYEASMELAALFTQQNALEDDENQLSKFNDSVVSNTREILVKHQLQSPNPTLETANQELLLALRQLSQKLIMPKNITRKQAQVAIEVLDLVTDALNAHLGNNKADNSKPFSKNEIILKLAEQGKLLENDGINGTFFIILGSLLLAAGLILLGGLVACAAAPSFGLSVCTMIGVAASINTASAVYSAGFIGFTFGLLSITFGGIVLPDFTKSSNANPEAAKAILDVSKFWDLEPAYCTSPSITG